MVFFGTARLFSGFHKKQQASDLVIHLKNRIDSLERLLETPSLPAEPSAMDPEFLSELEKTTSVSPSETNPGLAGAYTPVNLKTTPQSD